MLMMPYEGACRVHIECRELSGIIQNQPIIQSGQNQSLVHPDCYPK